MIVDRIHKFLDSTSQTVDEAIVNDVGLLSKIAFARQFLKREDKPKTLRLSSIGRCTRQQAYNLLGYEENGKGIDSRARMVFFMGDLTEIAVIQLARAAGCVIENVGQDQFLAVLDEVNGHPDGIIIEDGVKYLLEVKSMSSYGFGEFERGVLDEGYRYQINAYLEALKLGKCAVVALNKDAGVLAEMMVSKDEAIVADIRLRIKTLKAVTKESLPPRPYTTNDKGFLPWNCTYCSHWITCWPDAQKILVSGRYKLHLQPKGDTSWDTETRKSSKTASSSKSKKVSPTPSGF